MIKGEALVPRLEAPADRLMWIDSHCHVTADAFAEDRAAVLERAAAAGVERMIAIGAGYGVAHNAAAVALAAADPRVYAAVGVHPHDAAELDDAGRASVRALARGPARGGGRRVRARLLVRALAARRAARRLRLARRARARARPAGRDPRARPRRPTPTRSCSRSGRARGAATSRACSTATRTTSPSRSARSSSASEISFSGILTFKRDRGLRATAAALPLERLLVETDAPLLAPEGQRGARNEPARVAEVGAVLAAAQGRPVEEVAAATARNARAPVPAARLMAREARRRARPRAAPRARGRRHPEEPLRDRLRDRHQEPARGPGDRGGPRLRGAPRGRAAARAAGRRRARRGGRAAPTARAPRSAG